MIQVYTGRGKGKTTAAVGLAVRAAGHGFRVRIIQFMKGSTYSGELVSLQKLDIEVYQFGRTCPHAAVIKSGFMQCQSCNQCWINAEEPDDWDRRKIEMAWQLARDTAKENYDLLILDELCIAVNRGLVPLREVADWLDTVPESLEIIITGRDAPRELIARADLVTEMKEIKHPYEKGIPSRRGIEY